MKRLLKISALLLFALTGALFLIGSLSQTDNQPRSAKAAARQSATPSPTKGPTYSDQLEAALALVKDFKPADFTKEARTIALAFGLFNEWAKVADSAPATMSEKEVADRKKLLSSLSAKQKQAFPTLRDAYGPAMRKALWEADGKAKTIGSGYRTVEFISAAFAANRNIKSFHDDLHPTLMQMRFTRAQYKWVDANVEYSYYTMEPPKDGDVVVWNRSSYRPVK